MSVNAQNTATLEDVNREVIHGRFTGRVILHCVDGRIEDVEVNQRRCPPWKREGTVKLERAAGGT
jgi:hypothetical protein